MLSKVNWRTEVSLSLTDALSMVFLRFRTLHTFQPFLSAPAVRHIGDQTSMCCLRDKKIEFRAHPLALKHSQYRAVELTESLAIDRHQIFDQLARYRDHNR